MESKKKGRKRITSENISEVMGSDRMPDFIESKLNRTVDDHGSFLENIKTEWNLFWHGIIGESSVESENQGTTQDGQANEGRENVAFANPFETGKIEILSLVQLKKISRTLSQDRKRIHQKIEQINKEIEESTEKLESLKLVGSDLEGTVDQINKLHDIGQQLSHQLDKINVQIKEFRIREDFLKSKNEAEKKD